jgi:hypothetical protein
MKRDSMRKLGLLVTLSGLAMSLNVDAGLKWVAKPQLGQTKPIWEYQGYYLTVPPDFALDSQSQLYALSFKPNEPFAQQLERAPEVLSLQPVSDQLGLAVLKIDRQETLAKYARHAHLAKGFSCGVLQKIAPQALTAGTLPLYQPYFLSDLPIEKVENVLGSLDAKSRLKQTIKTLSDLGTRDHSTSAGLAAPDTVRDLFDDAGSGLAGYSSAFEAHDDTEQNSVIAAIKGKSKDDEIVIIGAHLDSINPSDENDAPGADDNASGIATLAELIAEIKDGSLTFQRRVEFHAYAAEEYGLVGSGEIADRYLAQGKKVVAMMQIDMNAYASSSKIYVVKDDTSRTIRRSVKSLLNTYLKGDFEEKGLTSGTSDHKSWHVRGFPTVFPFEDPENYNPYIHSEEDIPKHAANLDLANNFVKLGIAFLAHHAGLTTVPSLQKESEQDFLASKSQDLKLALFEGSGGTQVAVGAGVTVDEVELCLVKDETDLDCYKERAGPPNLGAALERNVFFGQGSPLTLAAGDKLRIMGYQDNKLVAVRNVELQAK